MSTLLNMFRGTEELELEEVEKVAAEVAEEVVKAEIAEVALEVEAQAEQVEELAEEVVELEEVVEEVEEAVDGMESMLGSGSFNSDAFALIYGRTLKQAQRLGYQGTQRLGAESLGDAATAQLMARDGLEGFMETVKSWGKKAAEFIKHIFNTVINFFVGLFDQASAIQRRAEQLQKRLEDTDELKEKIKLGRWNAYIDYEKGIEDKGEKAENLNEKIAALVTQVEAPEKVELASLAAAYTSLVSELTSYVESFKTASKSDSGDTKNIVGQSAAIRVMVTFEKDAKTDSMEKLVKAIRALKISYTTDREVAKKLSSGEVAPKLNKGSLPAVLAGAISFAKKMRENKVHSKFSASQRDKVVGLLSAIKAGDDDKEKAKEIDGKIKAVRTVYATVASAATTVQKLDIAIRKAKLDMVAAHL